MASQHTTEALKQILRAGTYHIIANDSFEGFSTRKLSKNIGLSDPYIYRCYQSTTELLLDCFYSFDKKIAMQMKKVIRTQLTVSTTKDVLYQQSQIIWRSFWNYFISCGDETLFYSRFLNSSFYTAAVRAERNKYYKPIISFIRLVDRKYDVSSRANLQLLLYNMFSSTITNAVRVIAGKMEDTEQNAQTVFGIVFFPVSQQLFANNTNNE